MSEQATWIPIPRKRRPKATKLPVALENANRLINWYETNKPSVSRLVVSGADYAAFEKAAGTWGISITQTGIRYRDFVIEGESQ